MAKMKEATSGAKKRTINQVNDVDQVGENDGNETVANSENLVAQVSEADSEVCIINNTIFPIIRQY